MDYGIKQSLICKAQELFLIRHHSGRFLHRDDPEYLPFISYSQKLLKEVSNRFEKVFIFRNVGLSNKNLIILPNIGIKTVIKNLKLENIEIIDYSLDDLPGTFELLKICVLSLGGRWDEPIHSLNTCVHNFDKYVKSEHIVWAGFEGSKRLKIYPERIKSFKELEKERENAIIW